MLKFFAVLLSSVLHNYFDDPTKLFLDLYLAKFLNSSAKLCSFCKYLDTIYL